MVRLGWFILSGLLLAGCNAGDADSKAGMPEKKLTLDKKLQQVAWMEGSWYKEYPTGIMTEAWTMASDTEFVAHSSLVNKEGDTMMTENIRLVSDGQQLWYIPTVSNQNNGKPVRFKEKILTDTMVTFENPEHDFPQRIIYRHTSDTTIEAIIEGSISGRTAREIFAYKKK